MSISKEVVYNLNNEQRQAVHEGMAQIAAGEFISNEDLEKAEDKWLNE